MAKLCVCWGTKQLQLLFHLIKCHEIKDSGGRSHICIYHIFCPSKFNCNRVNWIYLEFHSISFQLLKLKPNVSVNKQITHRLRAEWGRISIMETWINMENAEEQTINHTLFGFRNRTSCASSTSTHKTPLHSLFVSVVMLCNVCLSGLNNLVH